LKESVYDSIKLMYNLFSGSTMAIDHDRLFKELLRTFFAEFMKLFFPEVHESIDFDHVIFLSEEVFTDVVVGE
jgi:hypothetical protein